jgi:serine/threonine protein kinase
LLEGGTLDQILQREGRLPEAVVRMIAKRVLTGLNALHGESMAFLDCKPDNIGLRVPGDWSTTTLLDFGVSELDIDGGAPLE